MGFSELRSSILLWLWSRELQTKSSLSCKTNCVYILEKNLSMQTLFLFALALVQTTLLNSYSSVTERLDFYEGRWVLQIGSSLQGSELVQAFSFSSHVIHVTHIKVSMQ